MRAISSVWLERSAHNADGNCNSSRLDVEKTMPISMRNRVARSSNLRWPTREEELSVRVPASLPLHDGLVSFFLPLPSSQSREVTVPPSRLSKRHPLTGHIAQLGQSAGLLTPEDDVIDIPTVLPLASISKPSSGGSKPDVVSSNLTMPAYGIGEQLSWQSKT